MLATYFSRCIVLIETLLIHLKYGAFQHVCDPMISPYLFADDRCKIAVETRPRATTNDVVSRSLEGSDCKQMWRGYGLPSQTINPVYSQTLPRHGVLVSRESAQTSLPRLNIFNYGTQICVRRPLSSSLFLATLSCLSIFIRSYNQSPDFSTAISILF